MGFRFFGLRPRSGPRAACSHSCSYSPHAPHGAPNLTPMRGVYVLIVGVVMLVAAVLCFRLLTDPTAGVALLSFGVVLAGLGWHLRSREGARR